MNSPKISASPAQLGLGTSYVNEMLGRLARERVIGESRLSAEVILEAALHGFIEPAQAVAFLERADQPLSPSRPTAQSEAWRAVAAEAIQEARDLCARDAGLPAPLAVAIAEALSEAPGPFVVGRMAHSCQRELSRSGPSAQKNTPLTEAVLEFANENWSPSALLFWEDPMSALFKAARETPTAKGVLEFLEQERQVLALRRAEQRQAEAKALARISSGGFSEAKMAAASAGNTDIVKYLIENDLLKLGLGAEEARQADQGLTRERMMRAALLGVDINAADKPDPNEARGKDEPETMSSAALRALLAEGADPNAVDSRDASPPLTPQEWIRREQERSLGTQAEWSSFTEKLSRLRESSAVATSQPATEPLPDGIAGKLAARRAEPEALAPNVKKRSIGE